MASPLRKVCAAATASLVALGIAGISSVAPASAAPTRFFMEVYSSHKCLEDHGWATGAGAKVDQWACVRQNNELWTRTQKGDYFQFKNVHSGMCLNVSGNSKKKYAHIIQWPCSSAGNEWWSAKEIGSGYYEFKSKSSGLCMNIAGNSGSNGALLIQYPCGTGFPNEWITSVPV
ncbi:RICIN domain-containing protein [Streptomyces orinoci]|uniref:RICIN domain-containing protein n=1 Tax=Streptomyces orinoci TaxID=67339 RepID=A0ABV3K4P5_STRON|nr:RICIN domain-containing protein [Streptomyces orinoci]